MYIQVVPYPYSGCNQDVPNFTIENEQQILRVSSYKYQGRIQDFFRRGCTTKEWRNWLVTGRKQMLIANTKKKAFA